MNFSPDGWYGFEVEVQAFVSYNTARIINIYFDNFEMFATITKPLWGKAYEYSGEFQIIKNVYVK